MLNWDLVLVLMKTVMNVMFVLIPQKIGMPCEYTCELFTGFTTASIAGCAGMVPKALRHMVRNKCGRLICGKNTEKNRCIAEPNDFFA